jgi:soluble lytic murein transglycosylase-like protein
MAAVKRWFGVAVLGTLALFPAPGASQTLPSEMTAAPVPPQEASSSVEQWMPFIIESSKRFDIPIAWISAVMRVESGGQTDLNGTPITSPAGAMGLMQVMPDTYAQMQSRYGLGADPYDPRDNILAGTAYLYDMYLRYGYPDLLAAYNAGPARLDSFLDDGIPLPSETAAYLEQLGQPESSTHAWHASEIPGMQSGQNFDLNPPSNAVATAAFRGSGLTELTPSSQGLFVLLQGEQDHKQ